jgi:hypothetical protein
MRPTAGCFWWQQLRRRGGKREEGEKVINGMTDSSLSDRLTAD